MNRDIRWFVWLCVERELIPRRSCPGMRILGDASTPVLEFAESMLQFGVTKDGDRLQQLLDEYVDSPEIDRSGEPPYDPFTPVRARTGLTPKPAPAASARPSAPAAPAAPRTAPQPAPASSPAPAQAPAPAPASVSVSEEIPRPPDTVLPVDGAEAGVPQFDQLARASDSQFRKALISLLLACTKNGYSDLHLSAGGRPFARKLGTVNYLSETVLTAEVSEKLNTGLLTDAQRDYFVARNDFDFALSFDTGARYRVNLMRHKDGYAGTYRTVPGSVPTLEKLGFTNGDVIKKLLAYHNGLILVTGPLGSGKTTTLSAMVRQINETRTDHIITVEEPIEIILESDQCQITQRGVGPHTKTFRSALKGALRQDPDIIVIGEMRDLETIEMAISASETGHLVIGTMHTSDAATTLNRLLDVFPPAQQPQIRAMVAESLRGVVCQRLLPGAKGGVVLGLEVLLRNTAVSSLIREGKTEGLANIMETGKRDGMLLMDNSVMELWRDGKISDETAIANTRNRMLHREIRGEFDRPEPEPVAAKPKKRGMFGR